MDILKRFRGKSRPYCAAIIVAAGSAARMGGVDKIMAQLGGKPVILRTLLAFQSCVVIDEIVVVTREDLLLPLTQLCAENGVFKAQHMVVGGSDRAQSVMAGLDSVSSQTALVAIHDGARPLISAEIITKTVEKAAKTAAAAPAVPVKDTIKIVANGVIASTPDRSGLMAVQTPQVFDLDLILGALHKAAQEGLPITDDCAAVERLGMPVHLSEGSDENIKITTPMDLVLAEAILTAQMGEGN